MSIVLRKYFRDVKHSVPRNRSPGQTLVAFSLDKELEKAIDSARGGKSRSQFIREALAMKLGVSLHLAEAPDRAGKGGRPKKNDDELPAKPVAYEAKRPATKKAKPE